MSTPIRKPNHLLRRERKLRSWTLEQAADALYELCKHEPQAGSRGDINAGMISRWERGVHPPSPFYQRKLCQLYDKTPEDLGFVEPLAPPDRLSTRVSTDSQPGSNTMPAFHQAIDHLLKASVSAPGELVGDWLALRAGDLAVLFQEGWSIEEILTSLRVVLKGVQALSNISRRALGRKLLQLGAVAVLGGIPIPSGRHLSAEDHCELRQALGESIVEGWKLFHTARNAQVLAIGQAQLSLLQHVGPLLAAREQALFYSPVYRMIGGALHLQGRYDEALDAHQKAYLTALEGMDAWNMAQSRMWQAAGLKEQRQYAEALQTIEAAVRLTSVQHDVESMRTTAHLLASGAEIAALIGDEGEVQAKLDASEVWLAQLPGQHEEFDRAGWYEIAGVCAIHLKQHDLAVRRLQQAIETLPSQSVLRHVTAFMALVAAYANIGERNLSFSTAEQALPLLHIIDASDLNRQFVQYTTYALTSAFPHDSRTHTFLVDMQHQLLPQHTSAIME